MHLALENSLKSCIAARLKMVLHLYVIQFVISRSLSSNQLNTEREKKQRDPLLIDRRSAVIF